MDGSSNYDLCCGKNILLINVHNQELQFFTFMSADYNDMKPIRSDRNFNSSTFLTGPEY